MGSCHSKEKEFSEDLERVQKERVETRQREKKDRDEKDRVANSKLIQI